VVSKADKNILQGSEREQGASELAIQFKAVLVDQPRGRRAGNVRHLSRGNQERLANN
jgi:hypothetical protein